MSTTPDDLVGRLLAGRYRLTERIDRGGTAEVWRARDERLDRDVAVKILGREAEPAFRERFTMEARRAAAVNHPHIVTVFDEGQDGSDAFIVMEDVRGRSLRDIVAERGALRPDEVATLIGQLGGALRPDEVATLIGQLGGALDATHQAGLVHLDVKPANVIVDGSGNAKLTDFGIARAARDSDEREFVGTARYVAPERIEGKPATPRSDVYGLALVAYELLTGQPAFPGTENEDLLRDRLDRGSPHVRSADPRLPESVDGVIAKGLARDPERRYPTAGTFAAALANAVNDPATIVLRPMRAGTARRRPRLETLLALGVILAILVGVVLFFAFFGRFPAAKAGGATSPSPSGVPNVIGLRLADAIPALQRAGYGASWDFDPTLTGAPCSVQRERPPAGSAAGHDTQIALTYVRGSGCVP